MAVQIGDALVMAAGVGDDQAIHAATSHQATVDLALALARSADAKQEVKALLGGLVADAGQELQDEGIGDRAVAVGQDEAQGVHGAALQVTGDAAGVVIQFPDSSQHALSRFWANRHALVDHVRDCSGRDARLMGDLSDSSHKTLRLND